MTPALALALAVVVALLWAWRRAERDLTAAEQRADFHEARALEAEKERDRLAWKDRHQREVIRRDRAEFWDLANLDTPPPAAAAGLTPDDPSLLPTEVEQWLRTQEKP
ncbi:hypothetical protein [Micromonospora chersina]